jgi:hypothetical protein
MQTETTHPETQTSSASAEQVAVCANCRAQMPQEMRFCRACGFRLGEGVAEFTETVRFQSIPTGAAEASRPTSDAPRPTIAASPKMNACASFGDWAALAEDISQSVMKSAQSVVKNATKYHEQIKEQEQRKKQQRKLQQPVAPQPEQKRHRTNWMFWLILFMVIAMMANGFSGNSGMRGLRESLRGLSGESGGSDSRSWVGTSNFKTAANGVTFERVEPANSPADKAGLVGGDLVTTFDGQPVKSPSEFMKLLGATPVGKTVDVIYVRDGETKTAKLTTVSKDEMERLEEAAGEANQGYIGIGNSYERMPVPGTNISGVQLNDIRRNNPAYIAGLRDGDIVIEFDNVPIRTYEELESRTRRAAPDSTVKVVVVRGGARLEIPVKVGED